MEEDSRTKWAIFNNPLPLLEISNKKIIAAIDNYLPYSTGMEIECLHGENFSKEDFRQIKDLVEFYNDSIEYEQRYRIPSGLKGLVCLWNICEALKKNCVYHPESGMKWPPYKVIYKKNWAKTVNKKINSFLLFLENYFYYI